MSVKEGLLSLMATLRKAISVEDSALDEAFIGRNTESIRGSFLHLTRLRAQLSEAERESGEAD
jgi:hypothetical protein